MDIEAILDKYPINLRETIFKEIMHQEILESLFKSKDIQNTLVFQGGTALRLCYGGNRYSEDLDFVVNKKDSFNKEFMDYFKAVFSEKIIQKYGLEVEITEPKRDDDIVQRWSAKVYLPSHYKKAKINIEVANIPSYSSEFRYITTNYKNVVNSDIFVKAESLEEIFADKMVALSQRPYLKFRDLWDIEWLQNNRIRPNYEFVKHKINDYHCKDFLQSLQRRKAEISDSKSEEGFLREMVRFLDNKIFAQIKDFGFFATIQKSAIKEIDEAVETLLQDLDEDSDDNVRTICF